MKLRPVTKLDMRNKAMLKKLTMTPFLQIVTLLSFFQFMANLEHREAGFRRHSLQNLYFHKQ